MKKIYFLKNKVFRKDDNGELILTKTGKKIFRRDVGYSVAKMLEEKLGKKVIITDDLEKLNTYDALAINWGRSKGQDLFGNIFNKPFSVKNCVNKDKTYAILDIGKIAVPEFTLSKEVAFDYIKDGGCVIRHVVNGKGGEGVEVVLDYSKYKSALVFPNAPLFTRFFPKTHEARYHVFGDEVIQTVEKKKMGAAKREANHVEELNPHVRNHANGWALVKNDITPALESQVLKAVAVKAIKSMGLLFGAVDMMVKLDGDVLLRYAVAEVNTAPGIEGSTLELYTDRMVDFIKFNW